MPFFIINEEYLYIVSEVLQVFKYIWLIINLELILNLEFKNSQL